MVETATPAFSGRIPSFDTSCQIFGPQDDFGNEIYPQQTNIKLVLRKLKIAPQTYH